MIQLQIKNKWLPAIPLLLLSENLDITKDEKKISARRRFLKNFNPLLNILTKERYELQMQYSLKGVDGNMLVNGDQVVIPEENKEALKKAWEELNERPVAVAIEDKNSRDLDTVRNILIEKQKNFILSKGKDYSSEDENYSAIIEEAVSALTPKQ